MDFIYSYLLPSASIIILLILIYPTWDKFLKRKYQKYVVITFINYGFIATPAYFLLVGYFKFITVSELDNPIIINLFIIGSFITYKSIRLTIDYYRGKTDVRF